MSALVLLNFINKFRKRDKMQGLSSIFSFIRNEFNIFNNTEALFYLSQDIKITLKIALLA